MGLSASRQEEYDQLFLSIQRGDTDDVLQMLNAGLQINSQMESMSVLYRAVLSGHTDVVKLLLDRGCDVNIGKTKEPIPLFRYDVESPLYLACRLGHIDIVRVLLDNHVDVNQRNEHGMTAVWRMAANGNADIMQLLMKHPDVNVAIPSAENSDLPSINHTTPLIMSTRGSHDAVTSLLCHHPTNDVNQVDKQGRTALHYAVLTGSVGMTGLLLHSGTSVNCTDEEGVTPLYIACKHGHTDIVRQLIAAGADMMKCVDDSGVNKGYYPIHIAVAKGHADIVKLLCRSNPRTADIRTASGRTPLLISSQMGNRDIMLNLLKHGANPNSKDVYQHTALLHTISHETQRDANSDVCGHVDIIRSKEARHILPDDTTRSSASCDESDVSDDDDDNYFHSIEYLIQHGAEINECDVMKRTPCYYAVTKGTIHQTVILMKYGANIHPFIPQELSMMENCEKLKALIQIDMRFRDIARIIYLRGCAGARMQKYLESELAIAPSLKVQCRHVIRKTLLCKAFVVLHDQIQDLPLPKLLKWYVLLNDICDQFNIPSKYT